MALDRNKSLWHMIAAPTVWALHFAGVYAWTAIVCARGLPPSDAHVGIAAATIVALVLIVAIGWRAWQQWDFTDDWDYIHAEATDENRREFLGHAGWLLAIVSFVGVVYVAMPAFFIDSCL